MWLLLRIWLDTKAPLRILCWFVVVGWALTLSIYPLFLAIGLAPQTLAPLVLDVILRPPVLWLLIAIFAVISVSDAALYLVRCKRCSKGLFVDRINLFSFSVEPEIRHYRANAFLNSYRSGAVLDLATKGRLNCSWCGHELGTKPDYVVSAPQ